MAHPGEAKVAKVAHVNIFTDIVISNMSPAGLRSITRSLLAAHPDITQTFEAITQNYVKEFDLPAMSAKGSQIRKLDDLTAAQRTARCILGCGLSWMSIPVLGSLAEQTLELKQRDKGLGEDVLQETQANLDGDLVQAITAVRKTLFTSTGSRAMSETEKASITSLYDQLIKCRILYGEVFPFARGLYATASFLGSEIPDGPASNLVPSPTVDACPPPVAKEVFELAGRKVPRIFSGLWQLSSPSWGSAPTSKIVEQLGRAVKGGFTAFDMADHYGDAEIVFGRFWNSFEYRDALFAATKYCVFHPTVVSRESVRSNVSERCLRLQTNRIDLLQFHWQFYDDRHYLDAIRYLAEDERVGALGLCNFDTKHLQRALDSGVSIHSNQVQFSLVDCRPIFKMADVCGKHNVKLLTYGTLCGGFLADKWIGKREPSLYDETTTPSQRKYQEMIRAWGNWALFQELLHTLKTIGDKHGVTVSNVATRWVLDFPCVGAVIVGARMGISEHTNDNLASFGWSLDGEDQAAIEVVLKKSQREKLFVSMGDCGAEYR